MWNPKLVISYMDSCVRGREGEREEEKNLSPLPPFPAVLAEMSDIGVKKPSSMSLQLH